MKLRRLVSGICAALLTVTAIPFLHADKADAADYTTKDPVLISTVCFPDANFCACLAAYDKNNDGYLSYDERGAVTELSLISKSISNLQGIQYFSELKNLYVRNNKLTTLDLSYNTKLTKLNVTDNSLTILSLVNNPLLESVIINNNELNSIALGSQPNLKTLSLSDNQLSAIDLSGCTNLRTLEIQYNKLGYLDISNCRYLDILKCFGPDMKVTELGVGAVPHLVEVAANTPTESSDGANAVYKTYMDSLGYYMLKVNKSTSISTVPKPVFTTEPSNVYQGQVGDTITINVKASNATAYQWYVNPLFEDPDTSVWTLLSGATSATLSVKVNVSTGLNMYKCVASNVSGGTTSKSVMISPFFNGINVTRIAGTDRFKTSQYLGTMLRGCYGTEHKYIVVASSSNFADALAGSYLAVNSFNCPILLVSSGSMDQVVDYIKDNLAYNGTVYVLGGTGAVSGKFEEKLGSDISVKRLAGKDRYETNLQILNETGLISRTENEYPVLVCTGKNFADALSVSSLGMPILLVPDRLTDAQKEYLSGMPDKVKFYMIGGESVVTKAVSDELAKYGPTERIAGADRYETSVLIAEKFFKDPQCVFLAYGGDFPDGLAAGPMAFEMSSPIILAQSGAGSRKAATEYCGKHLKSMVGAMVIGGESRISDAAVESILK